MAPRGIWKGTLGFGLVNIGVELYAAEASQRLDLDLLDRHDHAPIGYRKYNKVTGREVAPDDIVKGYAVAKGEYVILSDNELAAANPKKSQSIDVVGFVDARDIDLMYYDRPYVIGALKGHARAYALLVRTLEETGRVGLAQVVLRTKQYLAAVYPYQHALVAQLLRYHDELRPPAQLGVHADDDALKTMRAPELDMARQLVEMMATSWDPVAFRDTYRDDVMQLIEARAGTSGAEGTVTSPGVTATEPRVLDLMAALKGSLAARTQQKVVARHKIAAAKRAPEKKASNTANTTPRKRRSGS